MGDRSLELKARTRSSSSVKKARITYDHRWCEIEGVPRELPHEPLTVPCVVFEKRGGTAARASHSRTLLLWLPTRKTFLSYAGLVPRIKAFLEALGYHVELEDVSPEKSEIGAFFTEEKEEAFWLDRDWLREQDLETQQFVRAVVPGWRAQIRVGGERDVVRLTAAAIRAFPYARFAVVEASKRRARRVWCKLMRALGERIQLLEGGRFITESRVHVTCFSSLDPGMVDIVIFNQAKQIVFNSAQEELYDEMDTMRYRLRVGFRDARRELSPLVDLQIEAAFGPTVYEVPRTRTLRADVHVHMADTPLVPMPPASDPREHKRCAIWQNDRRNDAIAAIATALVSGRLELLWEYGLFLDTERMPFSGLKRPPRVAILVENLDHGRELHARLPGWTLRQGDDVSSQRPRSPGRTIFTQVHGASLPRLDVDVLIRADGDSGGLELRGFPPRLRESKRRTVYLIDFQDHENERSRQITARRMEAYERRRWYLHRAGCAGSATSLRSRVPRRP
jgi:hypothetical protein